MAVGQHLPVQSCVCTASKLPQDLQTFQQCSATTAREHAPHPFTLPVHDKGRGCLATRENSHLMPKTQNQPRGSLNICCTTCCCGIRGWWPPNHSAKTVLLVNTTVQCCRAEQTAIPQHSTAKVPSTLLWVLPYSANTLQRLPTTSPVQDPSNCASSCCHATMHGCTPQRSMPATAPKQVG
jgi:hypothetical protein